MYMQGLMKSLSRFMPIVIVDEYGTTKNSCCCFAETTDMKTSSYKETGRRATVLQCKECKTVLSRDVSAAVNMHEMHVRVSRHSSTRMQMRAEQTNFDHEAVENQTHGVHFMYEQPRSSMRCLCKFYAPA